MSKYCPIVKREVIYQFCEDCEERLCRLSKTETDSQKTNEFKCMFCGKPLQKEECHNPEDYGLHSDYINFVDLGCCSDCNALITIPNRMLAMCKNAKGKDARDIHLHRLIAYLTSLTMSEL